jgi:hypothetical protein
MANPVYVKNPQVTRIPVVGPAPYNTLVVTQQWFSADIPDHWGETNNYFTYSVTVYTPFVLQGFDPANPPQFQQSTSVAFIDPGAAKNDHFLFAADEITDTGFDPESGSFYVTFNTALQLPDNSIPQVQEYAYGPYAGFQISAIFALTSYVLVNEPPGTSPPTGQSGTSRSWHFRGHLPTGVSQRLHREQAQPLPRGMWTSRLRTAQHLKKPDPPDQS